MSAIHQQKYRVDFHTSGCQFYLLERTEQNTRLSWSLWCYLVCILGGPMEFRKREVIEADYRVSWSASFESVPLHKHWCDDKEQQKKHLTLYHQGSSVLICFQMCSLPSLPSKTTEESINTRHWARHQEIRRDLWSSKSLLIEMWSFPPFPPQILLECIMDKQNKRGLRPQGHVVTFVLSQTDQ